MNRRRTRELFLTVALATVSIGNAQPAPDSRFKGSITGKVLDENGQPFPRIRVVVGRWQYHHGRAEFHSLQGDDNPLTRRDGTFVARNLDPGTYFLRAEDPYRRPLA